MDTSGKAVEGHLSDAYILRNDDDERVNSV